MVQKVNLADQLARFQELWSPKAVGAVNDFHVKLFKLKGEFVWHSHEVEDEHRPVADDEVHVLLLEPKSAVNTGTVGGARTREVEWL